MPREPRRHRGRLRPRPRRLPRRPTEPCWPRAGQPRRVGARWPKAATWPPRRRSPKSSSRKLPAARPRNARASPTPKSRLRLRSSPRAGSSAARARPAGACAFPGSTRPRRESHELRGAARCDSKLRAGFRSLVRRVDRHLHPPGGVARPAARAPAQLPQGRIGSLNSRQQPAGHTVRFPGPRFAHGRRPQRAGHPAQQGQRVHRRVLPRPGQSGRAAAVLLLPEPVEHQARPRPRPALQHADGIFLSAALDRRDQRQLAGRPLRARAGHRKLGRSRDLYEDRRRALRPLLPDVRAGPGDGPAVCQGAHEKGHAAGARPEAADMITPGVATSFKMELLSGVHNFSADIFMMALYTSAADLSPDSTLVYTTAGEASGDGYQAGGMALSGVQVFGQARTACATWNDPVWPAPTLTARGALIYNASKQQRAVAVLDFVNDQSSNQGEFRVLFPPAAASTALIRIL